MKDLGEPREAARFLRRNNSRARLASLHKTEIRSRHSEIIILNRIVLRAIGRRTIAVEGSLLINCTFQRGISPHSRKPAIDFPPYANPRGPPPQPALSEVEERFLRQGGIPA